MSRTRDDKVIFTIRIKATIDEKITQASDELGISKNAVVSMVLNEKFGKQNNPLEVRKES